MIPIVPNSFKGIVVLLFSAICFAITKIAIKSEKMNYATFI